MIDNDSDPYFLFPPPFQIPPIEYQSLVEDLPHLNFQSKPVQSKQKNQYDLFNPKPKGKFDTTEILKSIVNCVTTFHHPRVKGAVFTNEDKRKLLENNLMYDSTVNVLVKWIESVGIENRSEYYSICSNNIVEVIRVCHKVYKDTAESLKDNKGAIADKRLVETKNIQRHVKQKKNISHESRCIFFINNISDVHWNLVCLCNLSTLLSGDMMDMKNDPDVISGNEQENENAFKDYKPPCFLILDSNSINGGIDDKTKAFIEALRFWLSSDEEFNPSKIVFNDVNLPVFTVRCTMQSDSVSCGYFVFRNIIGLLMAEKNIFPLKIEDLVHNASTKKHYMEYLVSISKNHPPTKIRKIVQAKEMMYTTSSVQSTFRDEVQTLFERLRTFYTLSNERLNDLKEIHENQDQVKEEIEKAIVTSSQIGIMSTFNFFESRLTTNQIEVTHQLQEFFLDKKSQKLTSKTRCFCPRKRSDELREYDPHFLFDWTFQCKRTNEIERGFDFQVSVPTNVLPGVVPPMTKISQIGDTNYIPDFLRRIANGCQIHHTPISPSSGDCGFHLFAFVLCTSPSITKHHFECRKILELDQLLDFNEADFTSIYSQIDSTFYTRALFSQFMRHKEKNVLDLLSLERIDLDLKNIFQINTNTKEAIVRQKCQKSNFLKSIDYELSNPDTWKLFKNSEKERNYLIKRRTHH